MDWPFIVTKLLKERNKIESDSYRNLIDSHNKLSEIQNIQNDEIEKLKKENLELQVKSSNNFSGDGCADKSAMNAKMMEQQEELIKLHRDRGENAQNIINLNRALQIREKEIENYKNKMGDIKMRFELLENKNSETISELNNTRKHLEVLSDEHNALQLAYTSNEDKILKLGKENEGLISRLKDRKITEIDMLNAQLDKECKARATKLSQDIEEAAKESVSISEPPIGLRSSNSIRTFNVSIPSKPLTVMSACHESEVNAVKWSPTGTMFASGGSDRKVKIWKKAAGKYSIQYTFRGCNKSVTSVEFNNDESRIMATGNDYAARIWNLDSKRIEHTFTSHSGKVTAGKFITNQDQVLTGSHDLTIRCWDLKRSNIIKTIFTKSRCNDLVTYDTMDGFVSGHQNKTICIYDLKSTKISNEIEMQGVVTSLDISKDCTSLLVCSRDNLLSVVDLRMLKTRLECCHEQFRVPCDFSRAVFSPDAEYAMAGAASGDVFIWNTVNGDCKAILKSHSHQVLATSWNVNGNTLLSCDKMKFITVWADY